MKRVVVTGATSMVGVALIEECVKNEVHVLALVRRNSKKIDRLPLSKYITVLECDLDEMKELALINQGYDVFYHLGWSHTDKDSRSDARKQMENIEFTLDAIDLAERIGCKKFVGAGSQAEYGIHTECKTGPNAALNPKDAYGISKAAAGKLCSVEAVQRKMDFAWVRIFSLFGKYEMDGTLIQMMLPKILKNEKCSVVKGNQQWDYLYSTDAGEAFFLIGEKAAGINFYCLGSGKSYPLRQYVQTMKEVMKSQSELVIGDISYSEGDFYGMCADISSLQRDVGWKPKTSFTEGILKEGQRIKEMYL